MPTIPNIPHNNDDEVFAVESPPVSEDTNTTDDTEDYNPSETADNEYETVENDEIEPTTADEFNKEDSTNDEDEYEYEEEEFPDYIPEDFLPPEDFKDDSEKIEFYENKYFDLIKYTKSEKFGKELAKTYKDTLLQAQQDVNELLELQKALKEDPSIAFKKYFNEDMAKQGYSPYIENEEASNYIKKQLANEFGTNWESAYDPSEASQEGTISNKILQKHNAYVQELEQINQRNTPNRPVMTPEKIQAALDEEYKKYFEPTGMGKDEYTDFINEVKAGKVQVNTKDLYLIRHQDEFKKYYIEQGKKEALQNVSKSGSKPNRAKKSNSSKSSSRYVDPSIARLLNNK